MSGRAYYKKGIALVSALMFLVLTAIFVGIALSVSVSNRRLAGSNLRTFAAQQAAEAGIENVIYQTWFRPFETSGEETFAPSLEDLRTALDTGANGTTVILDSSLDDNSVTFTANLDTNTNYRVTVERVDEAQRTLLNVTSTGYLGAADNPSAIRTISETLVAQPVTVPGFAILTGNGGHVLDNMTVASLESAYRDGSLLNFSSLSNADRAHVAGTLRAKVAVLDTVSNVAASDTVTNSLVAGTLYARGAAGDTLATQTGLRAIPFTQRDDEPTPYLSDEAPDALRNLCSGPGACDGEAFTLFHQDYPTTDPPDGQLPETVPNPVATSGTDKRVSHDEWRAAAATGEGTLVGGDKQLKATTLSGTHTLDTGAGLPADTANELSSSGGNGIEGHLILDGSGTPLLLEGTVYVNGDIVINGSLGGAGKLVARGNIYISGDLTYYCDEDARDTDAGTQRDCDYGEPKGLPQVVLAAAGNIIAGAWQSRFHAEAFRDNGWLESSVFSDLLTCTSVENCTGDASNTVDFYRYYHDIGGGAEVVGISTPLAGHEDFDPVTNDTSAHALSFAAAQIALFNELEYQKAASNTGYTPRFYALRPSSPVYRCDAPTGCEAYFSDGSAVTVTEISDPDLLARAALSYLSPSGNWWSSNPADAGATLEAELNVRNAWITSTENNSRGVGSLNVDASLHAGGAIFLDAPESSNIRGEVTVRGALLAPDMAITAPEGLRVLYNNQAEELLGVIDAGPATLTREGYKLESQ